MSAKWDKVGPSFPTSIIGAPEDESLLVLSKDSSFQKTMQENLKLAKPEHSHFLKSLGDKTILEGSDPATMFTTVMERISPSKNSLQERFTTALQAAETTVAPAPAPAPAGTPKSKSKSKKGTASTPATPIVNPVAASPVNETTTLKELQEHAKIVALAGPISSFLQSVLDRQSDYFKSTFKTVGAKKHPIQTAIDECRIRDFRKIMEETFNDLFPVEERFQLILDRLTSFTFDDKVHPLITLRDRIVDTMNAIDEIAEGSDDTIAIQKKIACKTIFEYYNKFLPKMSSFMLSVIDRFSTRPMTLQDVPETLSSADKELRKSHGDIYPPRAEPVRAQTARPEPKRDRKAITNPCPACAFMFNAASPHTVDACYLNPANIKQNRSYYDKKLAWWTRRYPDKPFPTYQWDDSRKKPRGEALKSERGP
jgi:hypothetical protein